MTTPQLPTTNITDPPPAAGAEITTATAGWFDYPVRVSPHHTDHGGVVWHGAYLTWMEEARIEALRAVGVEYRDLVDLGCELPVVDLGLRYHRAIRMGEGAIVRCRMQDMTGIRLVWDYEIRSRSYEILHVSGQVTLVAVDWQKGRAFRKLPPEIKAALVKVTMR